MVADGEVVVVVGADERVEEMVSVVPTQSIHSHTFT